MGDERRRAKRVPVSVGFAESDPRTTTPVANLSRTGAFVVGAATHPVGTRIELRFVVCPEDPILFVHTGRVVRHVRGPSGMGVEFDPLPAEAEALLLEIIERVQRKGATRTRRRGRLFDAHQLRTRLLDED